MGRVSNFDFEALLDHEATRMWYYVTQIDHGYPSVFQSHNRWSLNEESMSTQGCSEETETDQEDEEGSE